MARGAERSAGRRLPVGTVTAVALFALFLASQGVQSIAQPLGTLPATFLGYLSLLAAVLGVTAVLGPDVGSLFVPIRRRHLLVGVAAGFGLLLASVLGYVVAGVLFDTGSQPATTVRPTDVTGWVLLGSIFVLTVVSEEVAFRGQLLEQLRHSLSDRTAIVVSAALFSLYHLSLQQSIATFVLGIGFAALAVHHRSLWSAVAAHAIVNGIGLLAFVAT